MIAGPVGSPQSSGGSSREKAPRDRAVVRLLLGMALAMQALLRRQPRLGVALFLAFVAVTSFARLHEAPRSARLVDRGQAAIALRMLDATAAHVRPGDRIAVPRAVFADAPRAREQSAPGYALVLFAVAWLDDAFAAALVCRAGAGDCKAASIRPLQLVQLAVAVAGLALAMAAAAGLSGSSSVALLTGLLLFVASPIGEAAAFAAPFVWVPALLALYALLAVAARRRRSLLLVLAAGGVLGAAALFAPVLAAAPVVTGVALAFAARSDGASLSAASLQGLAPAAGAAGVLALALSALLDSGLYDIDAALRALAYDFELRAAFNQMSPAMAMTGTLLPLPVIGGLVQMISPDALTDPFGPFVAGTFVTEGAAAWRAFPYLAEDPRAALSLACHRLAADPAGYLMSMPAVAMRGLLGGADLIGLIGLLHMKTLVAWHRADRRLLLLVAVAVPCLLLFLANTALTANLPMTNMPLAFLHAYAIAYVAGRL